MELPVNKIPTEFIQSIPKGLRLIKRNQDDFLLVESLSCSRGHNLIVNSVRIHDEPSIKLKVAINNEIGFLFIDSYWGSHAKLFSFTPSISSTETTMVKAFCPECDEDITDTFTCPEEDCNSDQSLLMHLPGGRNHIHVCAKLGCPGHKLDVKDLPNKLIDSVSEINFFGAGADEIFGGI